MSQIILTICEFCGQQGRQAHSKYTNRCDECGKRYSRYMNYKWHLKYNFSMARQRMLEDTMEEYKALYRHGHKVPRDLEIIFKQTIRR